MIDGNDDGCNHDRVDGDNYHRNYDCMSRRRWRRMEAVMVKITVVWVYDINE